MQSTDSRLDLAVITHARNAASGLAKLLPTVRWAAETVVIDMESTDDTVAVARAFGARVVAAGAHPRVDAVRNRYLGEVATAWTLVLDADEYLADDAPDLVGKLIEQAGGAIDAYAIPRFNRIGGQVMRGSGWYPDHQVRLFRRGCVLWSDSTHQRPSVVTGDQRLRELEPPDCLHIHHDNYPDLRAFIERQLRYALLDRYDPAAFDMDEYVTAAYTAFAHRHQPDLDGDLSLALATVMAWDKIMRGLIHWDQIQPRPSLENYFTLPVAVAVADRGLERELAATRTALAVVERTNQELLNTRALRLCRLLDRVRAIFRAR